MTEVFYQYYFHAVGQGLFAAGHLRDREHRRRFNWVFDSGTSSRRTYLQRELGKFRGGLDTDPIHLFCLSHFDEDHINGARELLALQRVDTLAMPYFPLVERILIALGSPGLSDDYLSFLVDPAGYMYAVAGENLGEVIFIAGGTPPAAEAGEVPRDITPDDDGWDFRPPHTKAPEPPANEDIHGVSERNTWRAVRVYGHQKPFTVGNFWEFMFYNEHAPEPKLMRLREAIVDLVTKHRRPDGSFNGVELLRDVKPLYTRAFGKGGYDKNRISLVVYSGPIPRPKMSGSINCGELIPVDQPRQSRRHFQFFLDTYGKFQVSIGYFGDFPLTSEERLKKVRKHYGFGRWRRLEVVQVPHHGSEYSWYPGASASFTHHASVISSARVSEHHPSQAVLDDLATHGVVLVHELQRAAFWGLVLFA
jgi:hypothetical protein